jgi:ubiquinone/menaquinone biosynthesis C-methylase UbiE
MNNKKHQTVNKYFFVVLLIALSFMLSGALPFFINLNKNSVIQFNTGEWNTPRELRLKYYIDKTPAAVIINGKEYDIKQYIYYIMFESLSPLTIRETFSNYKLKELKDTVIKISALQSIFCMCKIIKLFLSLKIKI